MKPTVVGKRSRWIRCRVRWEQRIDCRRRTTRYNDVTSGKKIFVGVSVYRRNRIYTMTKKKTSSTAPARRRPHAYR
jgi:hypothetical protein